MKLRKLTLAVATLVVASSGLVEAQDTWDFPDLSATQVITPGRHEVSMKVYRSGSTVRVEESSKMATLYVPADKKVYRLTEYPDGSRSCVVMKSEQAKMLLSPLEMLNGTNLKRTPAGTEVVEGHSCKVETVVVTRPDGKTLESKVWEAEDLKGVPVKIESQTDRGRFMAVYRDIVFATPDRALFTPPSKCTPFEKMGTVVEEKIYK